LLQVDELAEEMRSRAALAGAEAAQAARLAAHARVEGLRSDLDKFEALAASCLERLDAAVLDARAGAASLKAEVGVRLAEGSAAQRAAVDEAVAALGATVRAASDEARREGRAAAEAASESAKGAVTRVEALAAAATASAAKEAAKAAAAAGEIRAAGKQWDEALGETRSSLTVGRLSTSTCNF